MVAGPGLRGDTGYAGTCEGRANPWSGQEREKKKKKKRNIIAPIWFTSRRTRFNISTPLN